MPIPRMSREELKARIDAGDPPVIVDARLKYPYAHSAVTLPGAVTLPPGPMTGSGLPSGRDVVVYDSDPDELVSAPIAAALIELGWKAFALKGGIAEWMAASFPTSPKDAPAPGAPAGVQKA